MMQSLRTGFTRLLRAPSMSRVLRSVSTPMPSYALPSGALLLNLAIQRAREMSAQDPKVCMPVSRRVIPLFETEREALLSTFSKWKSDKAVFVKDIGVLERQFHRFTENLPTVRPFYAVKCNPDPVLLETLACMGAGFDCASGAEMEAIHQLGVPAEDIIFANPIKTPEDLKYAASIGVTKMTFDNAEELVKIAKYHPDAELVLRILPDDSGSTMRFGEKFGSPLPTIPHLFDVSKKLGLKVIGVSFHIGSGCFDPTSYDRAISLARKVFDMAEEAGLPALSFLDLGGGFPGNPVKNQRTGKTPSFEEFTAVINPAMKKYFPKEQFPTLDCIAEPGRYFATAWATLFTLVQGKRKQPRMKETDAQKFLYYINDGVYGSFNCIMFDHAHCHPLGAERFFNASQAKPAADAKYASTFFGPTCDSMDVICKEYPIEELEVGDWLVFEHMGAYTNAAATRFNGVHLAEKTYVRSESSL